MRRIIALGFLAALAWPAHAQISQATLVAGSDYTCPEQLPDGTRYDIHHRTLKTRWKDQDVFVVVTGYYKPGAGAFLYHSTIISKEGDLRGIKEYTTRNCKPYEGHVVLLENGEWVELWVGTMGPRIGVFHSDLRFASIGKAWQYVSTHFQDCECYDEIPLYKDLDLEFFRPERLRMSAAPYMYNPLVSAKKVGDTWEVMIKGADEPNRALVVLDGKFKLLKVTRFSAPK